MNERNRPLRRRIVAWSLGMAALGLTALGAQSEIVLITNERNGELAVSSYDLREDDPHNPRLQLLRRRERLDAIVSPARSELEKVVRLRAWAHRQWELGESFHYPPWDAIEILDLARQHGNRGFCAQYAIVFLQACQSMGLHARYVDLSGHFVVAVWLDDYDRWVVMDPTNDLHYERNGVPMGGREVYRAYWEESLRGVEQVDSRGIRRAVTREDLGSFASYSIDLRADQLSGPLEVSTNGLWKKLVHARDYRTYPQIGKDQLVIGSEFLAYRGREAEEAFPERPESGDQDEFRYAFNQTVMLLANERLTDGVLKVALLSSNSPTFERFLIRSRESADWMPARSATIKWLLHPGMNRLSARVETADGWKGTVSSLSVFYKPPVSDLLPAFRGNFLRLIWHRRA